MQSIAFEFVPTNGIRLHVAQAGPASGPLLVLLHGFPECWYGWHQHLPILAQAGFRVWAPDQRGYNLSDKPPRVADYRMEQLARDIVGLIDYSGSQRAVVVGHDWGAAVVWWLASHYPERLAAAVVVNVPHPWVMRRLLMTSPRQLLKSWYVFALQLPGLPEWGARRNNWQDLVKVMRSSSLPQTFSDKDFDTYRRAWSQPGAYTSMLNWYRAQFRNGPAFTRQVRVSVPTLILWGAQDPFVCRQGADMSLALCDHGELETFEHHTHWLQHERVEEVCQRVVAQARKGFADVDAGG